MRLINTSTLELETFSSAGLAPDYAVLSHTWGPDSEEVSFQEMTPDIEMTPTKGKIGFEKIKKACDAAKAAGILYMWVDTCCIDKSSSTELSEAINSMFKWYRRAKVCYAFLVDWKSSDPTPDECRWWTRGWTLQELIAPSSVEFFDEAWQMRGTKTTLREDITRISGIDEDVLSGRVELSQVSIATRMSWASRRTTSREEDEAYCLLGIFNINMPMLYGEGTKAFLRLQEEIVRSSTRLDMSIFAWFHPQSDEADQPDPEYMGAFAPSPRYFANSRMSPTRAQYAPDLSLAQSLELDVTLLHESFTSYKQRGPVTLPVFHNDPQISSALQKLFPLSYAAKDLSDYSYGVSLRSVGGGMYARINPGSLEATFLGKQHDYEMLVRPHLKVYKSLSPSESDACGRTTLWFLNRMSDLNSRKVLGLYDVEPMGAWLEKSCCLQLTTKDNSVIQLRFKPDWSSDYSPFTVLCRFRNPLGQPLSPGYWECGLVQENGVSFWRGKSATLDENYPLCADEERTYYLTKIFELAPARKVWPKKQAKFPKQISLTLQRKQRGRYGTTEFSIYLHLVPASDTK